MGPYAPSYWQTEKAICAKLLANGWGNISQATGNKKQLYATSYWLTDWAICARLLANICNNYWLTDGTICAKLLANGWDYMRSAIG